MVYSNAYCADTSYKPTFDNLTEIKNNDKQEFEMVVMYVLFRRTEQ